jgi:hypothetical protein
VLFVQQRNQDGIDTYRFTLPSSASHKQVGHGGKVHNVVFVINLFTQGYWQAHFVIHKLVA